MSALYSGNHIISEAEGRLSDHFDGMDAYTFGFSDFIRLEDFEGPVNGVKEESANEENRGHGGKVETCLMVRRVLEKDTRKGEGNV